MRWSVSVSFFESCLFVCLFVYLIINIYLSPGDARPMALSFEERGGVVARFESEVRLGGRTQYVQNHLHL